MPGHHDRAQRGQQNGAQGKQRHFKKQGQRAGQPDAQHPQHQHTVKTLRATPQWPEQRPHGGVLPRKTQVQKHAQGHEPEAHRRGHAAAHTAQLGHAQLAVNEHIVERHVDHQPQHPDNHSRTGAGKTLQKTALVHKKQKARQAPEHGPQKSAGNGRQMRRKAKRLHLPGNRVKKAHEH